MGFIDWLKKAGEQGNQQQDDVQKGSSSLSGFIATLVPVLAISGVYIAIWLFVRRSQHRYYQPRTFLLRKKEQSPPLPDGWFNWIGPFWKLPDSTALRHQSIDGYLFIRYIKICAIIAFVSGCITWPILFPVNATGGGGSSQLDILSFSNVDVNTHKHYYYAHVFVGWAVYGFVMYMITREIIFYINLRNAFFNHPNYARRISARTVLFTNVPADYLDEARLRTMFPNAVKHVWIAGDTTELDETVGDRDDAAMKLEKAEVKLIKAVNKARSKDIKKNGAPREQDQPEQPAHQGDGDAETGNIASRWVPDNKRPSHRLGFLGLVGKKVDTIEWARTELHELIPKAESQQSEYLAGNRKALSAVFIEFNSQRDAQAAYQTVTHHKSLHMDPKAIGITPDDVVWKSLNIPWWQIVIRRYAVYAFIAVLIIFWAIPVGIVGIISSVDTLKTLPGLTWIQDIPQVVLGVVSGLLPAVLLAVLMALVPIIMRLCAKLAGATTNSQVELFTQHAYFCFQIIQVFLVRTLTNAASEVLPTIVKEPGQVFEILSSKIPKASNFYISYFIVQGLTLATSVLTQVVGLVIFRVLYKFLAGTPRAMYQKWTSLARVMWGSLLPVYTNIVVIGITYSVIAPLILVWATIGLFLFYIAFRYNILYVSNTTVDTKGRIYPRALKQLFVGVYLGEICMVGLFAVSKAAGPAVLMVVFLVFTILYNITLLKTFSPLIDGLPVSLEAEDNHSAGSLAFPGTSAAGNAKPDVEEKGANGESNGTNGAHANGSSSATNNANASGKKPNMFLKFLKPWIYSDYHKLQRLVPADDTDLGAQYSDNVDANAFHPPSVTAPMPLLWIPQDIAGVSKQEISQTDRMIPITDEGCTLDENNKMHWDEEGGRAPIADEKIDY
ncbi:phosphate metabolism protein 7 [Lecanicillium sp. MT-2017a]|nr:phosphate metabolism protein 7 [Lecanicillium sp. MT-2017a]